MANDGAWVGERKNNEEAWIQVDLRKMFYITEVQTQGRNGVQQWITKFTLQYSRSYNDWTSYKDAAGSDMVSGISLRNILYKWYY